MRTLFGVAIAATFVFSSSPARADMILEAKDVGTSLQFQWKGTLDLSAATGTFNITNHDRIFTTASGGKIDAGSLDGTNYFNSVAIGTTSAWTGPPIIPMSSAGTRR